MDLQTNTTPNPTEDRRLAEATHVVLMPTHSIDVDPPHEVLNPSPLQQFEFDCDTTKAATPPVIEPPHKHHAVTLALSLSMVGIFVSGAVAVQMLL